MRRPFANGCLLFVGMVFLLVCLTMRDEVWQDRAEGKTITLAGKVYQKENRPSLSGEDNTILYLNHIAVSGEKESLFETKEPVFIQGVVCYLKETVQIPLGSTVIVQGKVVPFKKATNPGEFDSRNYYRIMKLDFQLKEAEVLKISGDYNKLQEFLYNIKEWCGKALEKHYNKTDAGIMKTILLGDKTDLEEEVEEQYKRNGIIHIMAISGLHISMLGTGLYQLLRKGRVPGVAAGSIAVGVILCYGCMTGMKASACRAILMFAMKITADIIGRTYDLVTALALAAVLLLIEQPLYVKHAGFLLSFGAVLGIAVVLPRLKERTKKLWQERRRKPLWKWGGRLVQGMLPGISILLVSFPIQISFYYQYPIYSILLNLCIVPLMTLVMISGLGVLAADAVPVFLIHTVCAKAMAASGHLILTFYDAACRIAELLPGAVLVTGKPEGIRIAVYYILLLLFLLFPQKRKMPVLVLLPIAGFFVLLVRVQTGMEMTFLDVGQGDCIYVRSENGNHYLFDGGSTTKSKVGTYQITPFVKSKGVDRLEAVFVSHGDKDHYSGIEELLEQTAADRIRIRQLVLPIKGAETEACKTLAKLAETQRIKVSYIQEGDKITDGILEMTCLNPAAEENIRDSDSKDINEQSQVFYLSYHKFSALLTGDITGEAEERMYKKLLEQTNGEAVTVLKVAHHGSKYSTDELFLESIRPVLSVISCGKRNLYGHPHEELLKRLEDSSTKTMITYETGAVTIWTDGERVEVEKYLEK